MSIYTLDDQGMLPSQFYERRHDDPYTQLGVAVLEVFFADWHRVHSRPSNQRIASRNDTMRRELVAWLRDDGRQLGGLRFWCEAVGIDPTKLRALLADGALPTMKRKMISGRTRVIGGTRRAFEEVA